MPESVSANYVHRDKFIEPKQLLTLGERRLKWYDIAVPDAGVPSAIHLMARSFLEKLSGEGGLNRLSDLGFVILHRCGEDFYFLIVCSWRGNNEIWETVFAKDKDDVGFRDWPRPGPHIPTYCVWEMGAVIHESQAWIRHLRSRRDEAAVQIWLSDQVEGTV
jgi:hypothetical protein